MTFSLCHAVPYSTYVHHDTEAEVSFRKTILALGSRQLTADLQLQICSSVILIYNVCLDVACYLLNYN